MNKECYLRFTVLLHATSYGARWAIFGQFQVSFKGFIRRQMPRSLVNKYFDTVNAGYFMKNSWNQY